MSDKVFSIEELRAIASSLVGRYAFDSVRLFGSYARGEVTPSSDIDIVVTYGKGRKTLDVLSFGERLAEATGKSVDAFEVGELDEGPLRDSIRREGVAIYPC